MSERARRHWRALRYSLANEEPYWFWTWGRWDCNAGFFKGFGVGATIQREQWDVTLGPFCAGGAVRYE